MLGRDVNVKNEILKEVTQNEDDTDEPKSLTVDEIIEGDKEST